MGIVGRICQALVLIAVTMAAGAAGPAGAAGAAGDRAEPPVSGERLAAYARACATYANRARFLPRGDSPDFLVMMADGCRAAQATLAGGSAAQRRAAARYLARLLELRDTVVAINMDRIYGRERTRSSRPKTVSGRLMAFQSVSVTGEFLIAHRMGLIAAYRLWRARAPEFALAQGGQPGR
ncbi:hypothetical protein [Paralimibaculum aggregatum]|nr:hypothetical protein [Limibaculum sp. NKW23]